MAATMETDYTMEGSSTTSDYVFMRATLSPRLPGDVRGRMRRREEGEWTAAAVDTATWRRAVTETFESAMREPS